MKDILDKLKLIENACPRCGGNMCECGVGEEIEQADEAKRGRGRPPKGSGPISASTQMMLDKMQELINAAEMAKSRGQYEKLQSIKDELDSLESQIVAKSGQGVVDDFWRTHYSAEPIAESVNWNVLYDSSHAKNVRARIKMGNMNESEVREWFTKTFQPMQIHELYQESNSIIDEEDMEEGNAFSGALAKAKAAGAEKFTVDGETYPVKEEMVDEDDGEGTLETEQLDELSPFWGVGRTIFRTKQAGEFLGDKLKQLFAFIGAEREMERARKAGANWPEMYAARKAHYDSKVDDEEIMDNMMRRGAAVGRVVRSTDPKKAKRIKDLTDRYFRARKSGLSAQDAEKFIYDRYFPSGDMPRVQKDIGTFPRQNIDDEDGAEQFTVDGETYPVKEDEDSGVRNPRAFEKTFTITYKNLRTGKTETKTFNNDKEWDDWFDQQAGRIEVIKYSEGPMEENTGAPVATPPGAKTNAAQNTTTASKNQMAATILPPGRTAPRSAGAQSITIQMPKPLPPPGGTVALAPPVKEGERQERSEPSSRDVSDMMIDLHKLLNGNYDLPNQERVLQDYANTHGLSLKEVLGPWVERSDGLKKAIAAVRDSQKAPAPAPMPASMSGAPPVMESHSLSLEVADHHEVRMAQADLYKTVKNATALHNMLDGMDELEGWVQAKITLAADYIDTVKNYLEYEKVSGKDL